MSDPNARLFGIQKFDEQIYRLILVLLICGSQNGVCF